MTLRRNMGITIRRNLRSVGQMYQKIQEEAQHSAAVQFKAVEDRLAEFK
jgi:hypothetical protein